MGPVCLIAEHQHSVFMGNFDDLRQIRANPIIGRVVDQDGLCIGVLFNCLFDPLDRHPKRDSEPAVDTGGDIDRHCAADDQRVNCTAMDIAGHDDLLACLAGGHDHCLHAGTRPADHQKGVICAKSVGCELLCLPDHRNRVTEVVQCLHRIHIRADAVAAKEVTQRLVAPSALMPRHVKMHHAGIPDPFEGVTDRDFCLIQSIQFLSIDLQNSIIDYS